MPLVNSLVPSRFLTILAHLVIVLTILFSRDTNVIASLPPDYEGSQFYSQDAEFIVAITLTLVAFLIELSGFFSGVSMFNNTQSLLSVGAHSSASIALLFFLFDQWPCDLYWWIFVFCSSGNAGHFGTSLASAALYQPSSSSS
ncbi:transmembrane protein 107 isoform X1 [Callorhinchus milii]|uniref:transmembrane protein 107 isoform X1 n=1 Tax=Callorhinchus milii TaxID=7868 RepID=UPI000457230D|nr:transmembrane protein 107 isoform X1 [Callorhinchus milii]|eukprot:gi/632985494/ref/XP_007909713.1/ PREDICTED: transmembrane protein 107 isoform X1 [Callorhinchus milii]